MQQYKVIGLTGGIGSGKSTVGKILKKLGANVIDSDQLSREVVKPQTVVLKKLKKRYGNEILDSENSLNRKKLGKIIFENKDEKRWLEELIHPQITLLLKKLIKTGPYPIVYEAPLLFEAGHDRFMDLVLTISVNHEEKIDRVKKRDNFSKPEILKRLNNQNDDKWRENRADTVIINNGNLNKLELSIKSFWKDLQNNEIKKIYN
jgi:dephospho-CoA kinase